MKNIFLLSILFILFTSPLYSQDYSIVWQQCLGGTETDIPYDIISIEDGYFIIGGSGSNDGDISFNHGSSDVWLIKTDKEGDKLWEKTFGGSNGEYARRILDTHNGSYYILGNTDSSDGDISNDPYPETMDYWIIKIDNNGNIIWEKLVGGVPWSSLVTGTITFDGGIVAYGWIGGSGGDVNVHYGMSDIWMMKLSPDGEIEWDFTLGTEDQDFADAIIQTSDSGFLLGGSSLVSDNGNLNCDCHGLADAILVKLDADRNIEWQKCYGGDGYDGVFQIIEYEDGYIIAAGAGGEGGDVTGWHGGNTDIWILKVDFEGNILWEHCFGGSGGEIAYNLFLSDNGEINFVGETSSHDGDISNNHTDPFSQFDDDIWIVKLNSDGEIVSEQCFGGEENESIYFGVIQKSNNNYVIAGYTNNNSYDVDCNLHGSGWDIKDDFWVFEIKDCDYYQVAIPLSPTGADTLCSQDSISYFTTEAVEYADHYAWLLQPTAAGSISGDSLQAKVTWSEDFEGTATLTVKAVNDCGQSDWSEPKYVQVENCTGINEYAGRYGLQVYPNPANDFVIFTVDGRYRACPAPTTTITPTTVKITNLYGQIITTFPLDKQETKWDISNLPKGVYFYSILKDNNALQGKIIIQ